MARPSVFSEEEDAIILATAGQPTDETNATLVAAGFPERSPRSIVNRRHWLSKRPTSSSVPSAVETYLRQLRKVVPNLDGDDDLNALMMRRILVNSKVSDLEEQLGMLYKERDSLNQKIAARMHEEMSRSDGTSG